jgi:hypothetical protein
MLVRLVIYFDVLCLLALFLYFFYLLLLHKSPSIPSLSLSSLPLLLPFLPSLPLLLPLPPSLSFPSFHVYLAGKLDGNKVELVTTDHFDS